MKRVVTVTDQEAGIEARVWTETVDAGPVMVTQVMLSIADGDRGGLRSEDLWLLEEMGLRLPQRPTAPPAAKAPPPGTEVKTRPAPKSTQAKPPKIPFTVGKDGRIYYERPPVEELLKLWASTGAKPAVIARHYGVKPSTISNWLTRLRKDGYTFDHPPKVEATQMEMGETDGE